MSDPHYYDICLEEAYGCDNIHFLGWLNSDNELLKSALGHASVLSVLLIRKHLVYL